MKTMSVNYNGKDLELVLNNTGILSAESLEASKGAKEAGLTIEAIKSMEQRPYSKGVCVTIGGKTVRCSWTFATDASREHKGTGSVGPKLDVVLDHIQAALDANPDNKKLREQLKEEIALIEERNERMKSKAADIKAQVARLLAAGVSLKDLGLAQ